MAARKGLSLSMMVTFHLLLLLCFVADAAANGSSVRVSDDLGLRRALADPQVQHIVLTADIQLQAPNWQRSDPSRPAVTVAAGRNIKLDSEPPYNSLDFAFLGSGWLKMAPNTYLTFSELVVEQSRYGVGMQFDFLAPSPSAYLVLDNTVVVRHLCLSNADEPEAIVSVPRIPGFPGQQRAHYGDYCLRDTCYENVLTYDDFTKVSTFAADTASGGHYLAMLNVTKVCKGYAEQCRDNSIAESCMQRAIDSLPNAARTPGRIEAEAEAAEAAAAAAAEDRRHRATLAAAISASAGLLLLAGLLVVLLARHRRWQRWMSGKNSALLPLAHPPGSPGPQHKQQPAGTGKDAQQPAEVVSMPGLFVLGKDVEQEVSSSSSDSLSSRRISQLGGSPAPPQAEHLGPPRRQDNWELAAWKTSTHSLQRLPGLQQQYQQQHHHSGDDLCVSADSGPPLSSSTAVSSTIVHSAPKQALSSHQLILQGTGTSTSQQMAARNKISLGLCIGAGSFGKVYRGKWRGIDVAVKVVQHSQAAAATVANEVDVMMCWHHPNLVSAYHFVTWRRRKHPAIRHHSGDQVLGVSTQQGSLSSGSLSCGGSLPAAASTPNEDVTDGDDEDMQTYIVQEFCDAGNLADYAIIHGDRQQGQLPTRHAMLRLLFRLREVADGMQFLHDTARVVHGDLKSNNILLCVAPTSPYGRTAKVADFGLAKVYEAGETHKSTKTLGTISHMAPELLRFGKASAAADVYSMGIMMWELLTGQVAFKGWQWGAILEHVALGDPPGRPPVPEDAPEDYVLLMEACWQHEPAKRPTFHEVLRCLNIMITTRQQELAAAASHSAAAAAITMTEAPSSSAAANVQGDDSQPSHAGTAGPLATTDTGAATDAGAAIVSSSNGEWDIVRVGSMRDISCSSAAATSSRSHAPRLGSKLLAPSGQQQQQQQLQGPGQPSGWQQQQKQQQQPRQGVGWSSDCGTSVASGQQTEGSSRQRCTDASWAIDLDHHHGPQDL